MQVLFQPEQNIFPPPGAPPPQAKWNLKTQLYENDVLRLEWTADRHIRLQGRFHPGPDSALHITEEVSSGF
jgi:hypothetical protein